MYEKELKKLDSILKFFSLLVLLSLITMFISLVGMVWYNSDVCFKILISSMIFFVLFSMFREATKRLIEDFTEDAKNKGEESVKNWNEIIEEIQKRNSTKN